MALSTDCGGLSPNIMMPAAMRDKFVDQPAHVRDGIFLKVRGSSSRQQETCAPQAGSSWLQAGFVRHFGPAHRSSRRSVTLAMAETTITTLRLA